MAKKGNMNISNDDFNFGDEMFPLDDSVYEDDDDLAGFKFDPNDEGPGGAKGFFKNTLKSIKGIGLDFADEFLPEMGSLTDEIKSAITESKDAFVEKKDKFIQGYADFKGSMAKKSAVDSKKAVKDGFKSVLSDIKKGKFYTSNRDVSIDMNAFMGDDDEATGTYEEDTSGKMTTKFNYKVPKTKRVNNIFVSNNNDASAMAEIQETATMTTASINTRLAKAQIRNSNQNFYETLNVLKNIDDNLYGLSKFLTHYGKSNINAQLEFDSKTLAFLTDQRALLKDILKANNMAVGIKSEEQIRAMEELAKENDKSLMSFGSLDMSKYFKNIGANAKDMFMGTQVGGMLDMLGGLKDSGMLGKGGMVSPGQMASTLMKSFMFNQMLGSGTKEKLGRLNDLFGNIGGAVITKANKWKDSDNPVFSLLGNLMGTDKGINRSIDLNTEDINSQTVFDIKTKETINEVIPGYLSQITAALTGKKATYYNHESKQFEERDSIAKKYEQVQRNAMNSDIKFSSAMDFLSDKLTEENSKRGKKALDKNTLNKGFDLFKKNLVESKTALDKLALTEDSSYQDKLFRGFDAIDSSGRLKSVIMSQIGQLSDSQILNLNTSIYKVASELEKSSKDFKLNMAKNGSLTAIAELNEAEKWEESNYARTYSSMYNEDLAKGEIAKKRARLNTIKMDQSEFMDRVGKVNLSDTAISDTSIGKVNDIYRLLLNGIKVYPSNDPKGLSELKKLGATFTKAEEEKAAKEEAEKNQFANWETANAEARIEEAKLNYINSHKKLFRGGSDDSVMGTIRDAVGTDRAVDKLINMIGGFMTPLYGKGAFDAIVGNDAFDQEYLEMSKEAREKEIENYKTYGKSLSDNIKNRNKKSKKNGKETFGEKLVNAGTKAFNNVSDKVNLATTNLKEKNAARAVERNEKMLKKLQQIQKHGSYFSNTLPAEWTMAINNYTLEGNGTGRFRVFIDMDYFANISKEKLARVLDLLKANSCFIANSTYEDNLDVVVYKNLDSEDLKNFEAEGVKLIKIKNYEDMYNQLKSYLTSSTGYGDRIKRYNKRKEFEESGLRNGTFNIGETVKEDKNSKFHKKERDARSKLHKFNKTNNANSKKYQNLSDKEKEEIEKKRKELQDNLNKAVRDVDEYNKSQGVGTVKSRFKFLSKINSSKTAAEIFLKKGADKEIDEMLASNDKLAILDFANKIKSKHEGKIKPEDHIKYLSKRFKSRVQELLDDKALVGKGVSIIESVRSPLFHFALYSKGRCASEITDELLKYAGYPEGINYFPEPIRSATGSDGITVRSLASNHLTGMAVDLNNGNISYKKLAEIAKAHGIRWAGEKDKPHFEYDEKFVGQRPYTKQQAKKAESLEKSNPNISKDGSILLQNNTGKAAKVDNKNDTKINGKPITYYQNDPEDTAIVPVSSLGKDSTIKEFLMSIDSNVRRLADNSEKIGFRFGVPGTVGKGLVGKAGDTIKSLGGKLLNGAQWAGGKAKDIFNKGLDGIGGIWNTGKDFVGGKFDDIKDKFKRIPKMSIDELIVKFHLTDYFDMTADEIKEKFSKEYLVDLCKTIAKTDKKDRKKVVQEKIKKYLDKAKEGGKWAGGKIKDIYETGKKSVMGLWDHGKDIFKNAKNTVTDAFGKGKDFLFGKAEDARTKAITFLKEKLNLSDEEIANMSEVEILKMAAENGFDASKNKIGGLIGTAGSLAKKAWNGAKGILGGGSGVGIGIGFGGKKSIISKMDEIIDAIYDVNDRARPEKSESKKTSKGINTEALAVAVAGHKAKLKDKFNAFKSKFKKRDKDVEGSYEDQVDDKAKAKKEEREEKIAEAITGMAAVIGTPASIAAATKEGVVPEPTLGSMMMANYQNAEKQNLLLEDISAKTENIGGGKGFGFASNLGKFGGKLTKGISTAGSVATVAGAAAGAAMIGTQVVNKVKADRIDAKNSTFGEKVANMFGGGGASNYDNNGNEITDKSVKAGKGFGLNQAGHVVTFMGGLSKVGGVFEKFSKLVGKIFQDPKIIKKLGGEELAKKVSQSFLKEMGKVATKPGILSKISSKITAFCAKVSQPVGWAVMVAQLVYDITSGMFEANRYFKMGKGMKPTWPMRITAGLAKALSGNLTFGLIPPATIANFIFKAIGKDSTKNQMKEAEEFDKKRAALMEVEYSRLVEFETMTWSEKLFGGSKKRATILGFMKGKNDKDGKERFETWFDKVYKPLDDMYISMVKQYGGKVDKVVKSDDVAALENRDKFREEYLKAASNYITSNKLTGLGSLAKKEDEQSKEDKKQNEANAEAEVENDIKVSEATKVEMESEGIKVDNKGEEKPAVAAASVATPTETPVAETKVTSSSPALIETPKAKEETPKAVASTTGTAAPATTSESATKTPSNKEIVASSLPKKGRVDIAPVISTIMGGAPVTLDNGTRVYYKYNNKTKMYEPSVEMLLDHSWKDPTEAQLANYESAPYINSDGEFVERGSANSKGKKKSKVAENAQADGINFGRIFDSAYTKQWEKTAEKNAKDSAAVDTQLLTKSGMSGTKPKKGLAAVGGKIFNSIKNATTNLIGKVKDSGFFKKLRGPADAIAAFVSNRKASEAEVSTMFNDPTGSQILDLQSKIVSKNSLGQQTSSANLAPEFAQRVEAFLKDPRVANHGVRIREGFRSPATQLAYFSKGRAPNSITDKLMKKAGFRDGINFWDKSFQKPGDYITWTLASNHFNGTAVDLEPGDLGYDKLGTIAAEYGIDWGGNWSTPDKPHFEMGDPNFSLASMGGSGGSSTIAEEAQADTINYDKMLSNANVRKAANLTKSLVNKGKSLLKPDTIRQVGASLSSNAKAAFKKVNNAGIAMAEKSGVVTSNLIETKFSDLLSVTSEGVDIMRELLDETKRHNSREEKMLENVIKGIAGLGAIMAAANNGGYSSANNNNSITAGLFDALAKGI